MLLQDLNDAAMRRTQSLEEEVLKLEEKERVAIAETKTSGMAISPNYWVAAHRARQQLRAARSLLVALE